MPTSRAHDAEARLPQSPPAAPHRLPPDKCVMPMEGKVPATEAAEATQERSCLSGPRGPGQHSCTKGWVCTNLQAPRPIETPWRPHHLPAMGAPAQSPREWPVCHAGRSPCRCGCARGRPCWGT